MKKLKIHKDIVLAHEIVSQPHWRFKKGTLLETDNSHLISTLLKLKVATDVTSKSKKNPKTSKEALEEGGESDETEKKMKGGHLNKKLDVPLNKAIE